MSFGYPEGSGDYDRALAINEAFRKLGWDVHNVTFDAYSHPIRIDLVNVEFSPHAGKVAHLYGVDYKWDDDDERVAMKTARAAVEFLLTEEM